MKIHQSMAKARKVVPQKPGSGEWWHLETKSRIKSQLQTFQHFGRCVNPGEGGHLDWNPKSKIKSLLLTKPPTGVSSVFTFFCLHRTGKIKKRPILLSPYSFFFRVSVWSDRITAMIDSCCSQAPSQVYQQAIDLKGFLQIYNNDWLHQGLTNRKYHRFKKNFKIPSQVYWNWCWGYFLISFGDYGCFSLIVTLIVQRWLRDGQSPNHHWSTLALDDIKYAQQHFSKQFNTLLRGKKLTIWIEGI